jgi:carboxymethylenebutenolidase
MVHQVALAAGDLLGAGVSFYGPAPAPAEAVRLETPLLVILAARDERVNGTALPYVQAAQAAGKPVRAITYPDVDHAFHNDTSAARYNAQAAGQAWSETMRHFYQNLRRA